MSDRLGSIYRHFKKEASRWLKKASNSFYQVHPCPIFVLGNEKSGTTVIAASLAKATQESVSLDIEGLWDPVQTKLFRREIDLSKVINRNKKAFSSKIIKEPVLTFEIGELTRLYPNAKFVLIVRDPRDNIRSILNRLRLPGNLRELTPAHIDQLGALWTTWNTVLDNSWLGLSAENYVSSMAKRWSYIIELYLQHQEGITLVKYEDFLSNRTGTIHGLAAQLNLAIKQDISTFVHRQFQPKGDRHVSWNKFFGEENLSLINETCRKEMKIISYSH